MSLGARAGAQAGGEAWAAGAAWREGCDALLVLDADRRIAAGNPAAAALLARGDEGSLVGKGIAAAISPRAPDGRPLLATGWPRAAALPAVRGIAEQEVVVRRVGGGDLRVTASGAYRRGARRELLGAVVVLRPLRRPARAAAQGIEIVSTVAHELRSPLTSVKGYTGLMLHRWERLRDDQKRLMLEQVHRDADRVTRLIGELLDISRLESGRMTLQRRLVDLEELAADVVAKVALEFSGLEATMRFGRDFPKVTADADKITQVLANLVENACKYGSEQGLEVVGSRGHDHVVVAVADNGPGIALEDAQRVFAKFYRGGGARPSGSGLGLWISRGLVEAHGGTLEVHSGDQGGAVFEIRLPLDVPGPLSDP